jgi:hypothetical protein
MIMAFFIVFSYATHFFNVFSFDWLEAVTPIVEMQHPRRYLDLHFLKIFFKYWAMVWNFRANRLTDLLHRLRTQIDNMVDGINRVPSQACFDISSLAVFIQ